MGEEAILWHDVVVHKKNHNDERAHQDGSNGISGLNESAGADLLALSMQIGVRSPNPGDSTRKMWKCPERSVFRSFPLWTGRFSPRPSATAAEPEHASI